MVAAGRLADITADHIEISDTEVIDAADDVAQLRLVRDLPGGEMRDDFISCLDREFCVAERSSQAELRRTGDGNLRARRDGVELLLRPAQRDQLNIRCADSCRDRWAGISGRLCCHLTPPERISVTATPVRRKVIL